MSISSFDDPRLADRLFNQEFSASNLVNEDNLQNSLLIVSKLTLKLRKVCRLKSETAQKAQLFHLHPSGAVTP